MCIALWQSTVLNMLFLSVWSSFRLIQRVAKLWRAMNRLKLSACSWSLLVQMGMLQNHHKCYSTSFTYIRTYVCTYWFCLCKGLSCSGTYALLYPSQAPSPLTLLCRPTYTLTSHGSPSSRYLPTYLCTHLNRYVHTRKSLSLHSIQYCTVHTIQHIRTLHTILHTHKVVLFILCNIIVVVLYT